MQKPATHLVFTGLPKSANVFIRSTLKQTLDLEWHDIYPRGITSTQISLPKMEAFLKAPRATTGQHFPGNEWNRNLLITSGVDRLAVVVRDPRDALVSWWHHLEREDIGWGDRAELIAAGIIEADYASLPMPEKLTRLIIGLYPFFQDWLREWAAAIDTDSRFAFKVVRYEDFAADPYRVTADLLRFYGHAKPPVFPAIDRSQKIDPVTHFRRGMVGSHRDEMTAAQLRLLSRLIDHAVFARFGWSIEAKAPPAVKSPNGPAISAAYNLFKIRNAGSLEWFAENFRDKDGLFVGTYGEVFLTIDPQKRTVLYDDFPDMRWTEQH